MAHAKGNGRLKPAGPRHAKSSFLVFILWALAALFWMAVTLADAAGWRINHTPSLPMGLWRVRPAVGPIAAGQIVSFCPPDSDVFRLARQRGYLGAGACPGGVEPMLKPVVAVAGDNVEITVDGVAVNGHLIANSAVVPRDSQGRELPQFAPRTFVVAAGELWLISSYNVQSFDSRYFGPIATHQIIGIASH